MAKSMTRVETASAARTTSSPERKGADKAAEKKLSPFEGRVDELAGSAAAAPPATASAIQQFPKALAAGGSAARSRLANGLQKQVGNGRLGRMFDIEAIEASTDMPAERGSETGAVNTPVPLARQEPLPQEPKEATARGESSEKKTEDKREKRAEIEKSLGSGKQRKQGDSGEAGADEEKGEKEKEREQAEQAQSQQKSAEQKNTAEADPAKQAVAKEASGERSAATAVADVGSAIGAGGTAAPMAEEKAGGGATDTGAAGAELEGGSEEEGADELERRLAKADPERAAADREDPVDVVRGDVGEAETEAPAADMPDNISPMREMAAGGESDAEINTSEAFRDTATDSADTGAEPPDQFPSMARQASGILAQPTAAMPEETPVSEPESAGGFSGDEPALGGAALEESPQLLSDAEQAAALESIGDPIGKAQSVGVGGGGGGSPIDAVQPKAAPDVSSQKPAAALATVGGLSPVQMKQALGGVNNAVTRETGEERAELAANPPSMERPSGSPKNLHGQGKGAMSKTAMPATAEDRDKKVKPVEAGRDQPTEQPVDLPEPTPSPAEAVREPVITGGEGGEISGAEATRLSSAIDGMPTTDPGLNMTAGPPPRTELSGNADPGKMDAQKRELQVAATARHAQGRREAAVKMGENIRIYPSFEPETLIAEVPATAGGKGKGNANNSDIQGIGGEAGPVAISFIAQKEKGGDIQAAIAQGQADINARRKEHTTAVSREKAASAKDIAELEARNTAEQAQVRSETQATVKNKKTEWTQEQDKVVREANTEAEREVAKSHSEIIWHKTEADEKAAEHIRKGNEEADAERQKAEREAAAKKREAEEKKSGGGFFGWVASKAKAFFNKIKEGIKAAFDLARKLIKKAIEAAKKAAMWVIEQARKAIVAAIQLVGKVLIAIGDRLLAAFPALRDKFRNLIQNVVDSAVDKVNALADKLKKGVSALLDLLAAGLDKLLSLLEKGLLAAVDGVAKVVDGAIRFAEKVAQAFGAFAVLIKDIIAGPVRWIANLAVGAKDGIVSHLWSAFKEAVQEWFNSKLEQVLGLGKMVWDLIKSGGLSLAKVGQMAWEGIKAMIPPTLIRILIEKVVAMIVPAAGAVMVIIEGLQAAWGAVSRIIASFKAFFRFLKAVRTGNAGPPFAAALAAAAVAVIDFVANWLIAKLAKGAAKVGGKIKGLTKKLLGRSKGGKGARKNKSKMALDDANRPKHDYKRKLGKSESSKRPKKDEDWREKRKKKRQERLQNRWNKGIAAINRLVLRVGINIIPTFQRKIHLAGIKLRYRFKHLKLEKQGRKWVIDAWMNPRKKIDDSNAVDINDIPTPPDAGAGARKYWGPSKRGNTRLYCTDNDGNKWHYVVTSTAPVNGHWQSVKSTADIKKAEQDARAKLLEEIPNLIQLVSKDKEVYEQGFDVMGIGRRKGEEEERLHIGDAKFGGSEHTKYLAFKPTRAKDKPLSATTTLIASNIEKERQRLIAQGEIDIVEKLDTALTSGRVTITYYMRGNVRISLVQIKKITTYVRTMLNQYLRMEHKLSQAQAKKVVREVQVETRKI